MGLSAHIEKLIADQARRIADLEAALRVICSATSLEAARIMAEHALQTPKP